jgi:hypothetical protein
MTNKGDNRVNQTQKNYTKKRIEALVNVKIKEVHNKMYTPGKNLTYNERVNLIYSGKVKLRPRNEVGKRDYGAGYITDLYDFSDHEYNATIDKEAYDKACNLIRSDAHGIIDEVMIGDCDEALKMIKEFSTKEYA